MAQHSPHHIKAAHIKTFEQWHLALSKVVMNIGLSDFESSLNNALHEVMNFDYLVIFAYHKDKKPIELFNTFDAKKRDLLVTQYLEGPYFLDPFYQACQRNIEPGLHLIKNLTPIQIVYSEYFKTYYNKTGLSDEACFLMYPSHDISIVVSLMRDSTEPTFSVADTKILNNIAPLVEQLGQKHWCNIGQQFTNVKDTILRQDDINQIFDMFLRNDLPPREREVASYVLKGYSSAAIATELNLAIATVKTYRRNIYGKLRISSQNELFSLFLDEICRYAR